MPTPRELTHDEILDIVKEYFSRKGYKVLSGLQFGCELVLYADSPTRVHSDFCVKLADYDSSRNGYYLDWRMIQTLARSMPDLHKTLLICQVRRVWSEAKGVWEHSVDELAVASEHAPFRYREKKDIGEQTKRLRTNKGM